MLINSAVYEVIFRAWRREPGLWMLAAFLAIVQGAGWWVFEFEYLRGLWTNAFDRAPGPPAPWPSLIRSLDATMALSIWAKTARLAVSVAIQNRKAIRPGGNGNPSGFVR